PPTGSVTAEGSLTVQATTTETVFSTAFAGVVADGAEEHDAPTSGSSGAPAPNSVTHGNAATNVHQGAGVAISGAAVVNDLHKDSTQAFISDGVPVETRETLTVKANSDLLLMTAAGVLAASSDKQATSNVALAGGFAYNNLQKDASGSQRDV